MVSTVTSYTDSRNRAEVGTGYDGVVRISVSGYYGTGVLLYDGRAILTAAHVVHEKTGSVATSAVVHFETTAGSQSITANSISVIPSYDAPNSSGDLALIWLSQAAPVSSERYELYRDNDELTQIMTLVGYGKPGTGATGTLDVSLTAPLRLKAQNTVDADAGELKAALGATMGWTPLTGSQLVADFDNGQILQDALGILLGKFDSGLDNNEGSLTPGDSGGPAFINHQVAGIASYGASLSSFLDPDIDSTLNSSFGELGFWQRISYYQQWIDQSMRAKYVNAPTTPAQVNTTVTESDSGTTYAYFLLQFNGTRSSPDQILSVDYATRNGTALAGQDYIAVSGKLQLYAGETQAVIPVEIIGDKVAEPDETFYLDVSNPVGGHFANNAITLTAVRTIHDNDGWIA